MPQAEMKTENPADQDVCTLRHALHKKDPQPQDAECSLRNLQARLARLKQKSDIFKNVELSEWTKDLAQPTASNT